MIRKDETIGVCIDVGGVCLCLKRAQLTEILVRLPKNLVLGARSYG